MPARAAGEAWLAGVMHEQRTVAGAHRVRPGGSGHLACGGRSSTGHIRAREVHQRAHGARKVWLALNCEGTVARSDQRRLCTKQCLNDRLNGVEGRTQCTLEVVPTGQKPR